MTRHPKALAFDQLQEIRHQHPDAKIVHCHGVFDVLHAGHLHYFRSAKNHGDLLVVTLTADAHVNKGPGRPYFSEAIRAEMIAALELVDYVAINTAPTATPVILALRPHFYVKGPDYRDKASDLTGGILKEEAAVTEVGGQLVFTADRTFSSSSLINQFFSPWSEEQQKAIEGMRAAGGMELINEVLDRISRRKVLIAGEPIIDTYVFCLPENLSSKRPSISAKLLYEEQYAGGSLAIANHMASFVRELELVITHGAEPSFASFLQEKMDPRVRISDFPLVSTPTPKKTRFIATDRTTPMFELTDLRHDQWERQSAAHVCARLEQCRGKDTIKLLADFGHGFFEGPVLDVVANLEGFVGLNVQTNSSNLGFNPFTKHKKFTYLSIDTREVRLAYHDRFSPPFNLARRLAKDLAAFDGTLSLTLGSNGAYHFESEDKWWHAPAMTSSVIDPVGAGDAFFAISSLLIEAGCPRSIVPLLSNTYAGLQTRIIGNKTPVTKSDFLKALHAILA